MNSKSVILAAACLSIAAPFSASGSEAADSAKRPATRSGDAVATRPTSMFVYQPDNYDWLRHYAINNDLNSYTLSFLQTKNIRGQPPTFFISVPVPKGGFSRLWLNVNEISSNSLFVAPEHIADWTDPASGARGYDLRLNFDGVKLLLRFFMRPDSPLLRISVIHLPESIAPLASSTLTLHASLNRLEGKAMWDVHSYRRELVTPLRTISDMGKKQHVLSVEENSVILRDLLFDGSGEGKGNGPSYLVFDRGKASCTSAQNDIYQVFTFQLNPDFRQISLGVWKSRARISNSLFAELLSANRAVFQ